MIGHLTGADRREPLGRHAGPAQRAVRLHERRRRHHGDRIAPPVAAGFEHERHVEHHQLAPRGRGPAQEPVLRLAHPRMQDGFEARGSVGIAEDALGERVTIDATSTPALDDAAGKRRLDRGDGGAAGADQPVDFGVGVEHRGAATPQRPRGGGLAHADRAGEPEDNHGGLTPRCRAARGP